MLPNCLKEPLDRRNRHDAAIAQWLGRLAWPVATQVPRQPPRRRGVDCLWTDGRDLRGQALRDRRDQLDEVLDGRAVLLPARRLSDDGLTAWHQVVERGYDGL